MKKTRKPAAADKFVPNQDTLKQAMDNLDTESRKRVEKLTKEAKERGKNIPLDQIKLEMSNKYSVAGAHAEKLKEQLDKDIRSVGTAFGTIRVNMTDPNSPLMKFPDLDLPTEISPHFSVIDQATGLTKSYTSVEDALKDFSYPESIPGIKQSGESKKQYDKNNISRLITELVRNPTTRKYIIKVITGNELDAIMKESFGENAVIYNDIGYEYLSGVVATGTIIKNYRLFKIWYEGYLYNQRNNR